MRSRIRLVTLLFWVHAWGMVLPQTSEAQNRWRLEEELRIGAVDGPTALNRVGTVVSDRGGRFVYVTQTREQAVRVFDARTGSFRFTIGRSGSGPGEFQRVGDLSWRGDSLFVSDPFQQRFSVFDHNGEHLLTFRVDAPALADAQRPPLPWMINPGGGVWAKPAPNMISVARGIVEEVPIVIVGRDGVVIQQITQLPMARTTTLAQFEGGVAVFTQPLRSPYDRVGVAPDGSAMVIAEFDSDAAENGRFSIRRIGFRGDTVFNRAYRFTPLDISTEQRDSIIAHGANTMFRSAGRRARRVSEDHVHLPATQPPVSQVIVESTGRTWIRREPMRSPARWIALSSSGEVEGTLQVQSDIDLKQITATTAWGVVHDDLGVPYVIRYRLVTADQ